LAPTEALRVGLIDQIVDSDDELLAQSIAALAAYQRVPSAARVQQKLLARGPLIAKLERERYVVVVCCCCCCQ
jgi:enoyl-CoA hydratase/carnithine racemase